MRPLLLRLAVVGGLLAGTAAVAQPPAGQVPAADAKKLKNDLEALLKDRAQTKEAVESAGLSERDRLMAELRKKLEQIGELNLAPPPAVAPPPKELPPPKAPKVEPTPDPFVGAVPLDPLRVAQNLYKAGDIEAAYRAIQMQKPDTLSPDDRTFAQYLSACCLRKMGKLPEAAAIYREIADAKQDAFITQSALTQLSMIRSVQEIESQLEQLRAPRKLK